MLKLFSSIIFLSACICFSISSTALSDTTSAIEPGFDCSKATSNAEELVCKDNELAELDNQLTVLYKTALGNFSKKELNILKAEQRGWIKGRDECWKDSNLRSCVRNSYESRITELLIKTGTVTAPEPVTYQCDGSTYDHLTVVFHKETPVPVIVLTRTNEQNSGQLMLWPVPTGSGARYSGKNVVFWSKGNEAIVEWNNAKLNCKEMTKQK